MCELLRKETAIFGSFHPSYLFDCFFLQVDDIAIPFGYDLLRKWVRGFFRIYLVWVCRRSSSHKISFKRSGSMEPQKILIFGLGFIFCAGVTLFISFKLQSSIKTKKNKNLVNLLSFLFLAVVSIFIFRMYSQEYIAALSN